MCGPENKADYNPAADTFASGGDGYKPRARYAKKADRTAYEPHMHTSITHGSCMDC